jgi:uncharacterized membrane protein
MNINTQKENVFLYLSRLFFVMLIFSYAGWVWEVIHVSILAGELVDRGFLFGPVCPIYGLTMVAAYLLIGSPKEPNGILRFTRGKWYQYPLYTLAAIALPTLVELIVGYGCELLFGMRLWDYAHYVVMIDGKEVALHFLGYIALPISLIWLVLIYITMGLIFPALLKLMEKIQPKTAKVLTAILGSLMVIDVVASCIAALI